MDTWLRIKSFFSRSKLRALHVILKYIQNSEEELITISSLQKKFGNDFNKIRNVMEKLPYLSFSYSQKKKERTCKVLNQDKLLRDIISIDSLISNEWHRSTDLFFKVYSLLLTVLLIMVGVGQLTINAQYDNLDLRFNELSYKPDLVFTQSDLDNEFINFTQMTAELKVCILNRGGVDSGPIKINITGPDLFDYSKDEAPLMSKNYKCLNHTLTLKENVTETDFHVKYSCLNCGGNFELNKENVKII